MYYYIKGILEYKNLTTCVVDCGGVGYKLTVSQLTSSYLSSYMGKEVKLFTHLAVREDGIELFGFGSDEERTCFNKLTSVSGVGPKVAMGILSVMTPRDLAFSINTEDTRSIAKAPGVGAKTAARIVLELRDKIGSEIFVSSTDTDMGTPQSTNKSTNLSEAIEALMVLGYDKNTALNAIKNTDTSKMEAGEIIRLALKKLSK